MSMSIDCGLMHILLQFDGGMLGLRELDLL
jgi:hypothetical protein